MRLKRKYITGCSGLRERCQENMNSGEKTMRIKKFMAIGLTAALCAAAPAAQILAAPVYDVQNEWNDAGGEDGTMELSGFQGQPGNTGGQSGGMGSNVTYADSPSEIITGTITTSASELTADEENAETIMKYIKD